MASRAAAVAAATSTRTAMAAKKNVHIENWASFRENCEHVFEVSLKNLSIFGVAGVAVPYCIYRTVIDEQVCCRAPALVGCALQCVMGVGLATCMWDRQSGLQLRFAVASSVRVQFCVLRLYVRMRGYVDAALSVSDMHFLALLIFFFCIPPRSTCFASANVLVLGVFSVSDAQGAGSGSGAVYWPHASVFGRG